MEKEKNLKYLHNGNSSRRYASSWVDAEDEMDGGEQLLLLELCFKNLFKDMLVLKKKKFKLVIKVGGGAGRGGGGRGRERKKGGGGGRR